MFIYGLANPITKEIFYVGKTNNLEKRFKQHYVGGLGHNNTFLRTFIVSLRMKKLSPEMVVLETCESEVVDNRELFWINQGILSHWPLTNRVHGPTAKKHGAQHQINYIQFLREKIEAI